MGVEGLKCDTCSDEFYGLSADGCQGKSCLSLELCLTIREIQRLSNEKIEVFNFRV